jgi:hypothetical protein
MKIKSLFTGMIASLMLLSGPVFAQTADGNIGNSDTGKNSENTVDVSIENETRIVTNNDADVDNDISVKAETGENKIEIGSNENHSEREGCENCDSTGAGNASIETGNATATATVSNNVNTTDVSVEAEEEAEEEEKEEEEGGKGQGEVVTPAAEQVAAVTTTTGGLGAGSGEVAESLGLGAGPLAEAGAGIEGLIAPLMLSSIVTFLTWMRRKNLFQNLS